MRGAAGGVPLLAELGLGPAAAGEPDGEDDGTAAVVAGVGLRALATASGARWERVGAPPRVHPRVCDLTPHAGALFMSTATRPIGTDGALIHRYSRADGFALAFDWDRGATPRVDHERGGQGLTRVRVIDGRLYATDSDAPLFGGFGLTPAPLEDYLFVSDPGGVFPPLGPDDSPPAGTVVMPFAFHAFDVIGYRGALVASGGTVALEDRSGTPYPGGLWVGEVGARLLEPRFFPGQGHNVGVLRTTYMHRYRGRLYVGFQNNRRRARWDLAVLSGDPRAADTPAPILARVTADGGWVTRRFASGAGRLYWVASGYAGDGRGAALFVSGDGLRFERVALPDGAGRPQDVAVVGDTRYLLTTAGVYRARGDDEVWTRLVAAPPGDPFGSFDTFCSAPLTVYDDALYAGSSRDGALYRLEAAP